MLPDKEKAGEGKIPAGSEKNIRIVAYTASLPSATDLAAHIVARRYRLSLSVAKLVCELASIGGRAA